MGRKDYLNEIQKAVQRSFWHHFDLISNAKKIVSPPKFRDPISQTFTIARPLSMLFVILYHEFSIKKALSNRYGNNYQSWKMYEKTSLGVAFTQMGFYSVDIFFFIEGYVSITSIQNYLKQAQNANRPPLLTFVFVALRRYARFAPLMLLTELYMMAVVSDLGRSPYTALYKAQRSSDCRLRSIFRNMILVLPVSRCSRWTWYLQCDLNMYILVVLIVMLTKTAKQRNLLMVLGVALSFLVSGLMIYWKYLSSGVLNSNHVYETAVYRLRVYLAGSLLSFHFAFYGKRGGKVRFAI